MLQVEQLAKELFDRYCLLTVNKQGLWAYLSTERKIAWMKEVIFFTDFLASSIKGKIKPLPPFRQNETVYMTGYQNGLLEERTATINLIEYVDQDLKKQLKTYIEQQEKLQQQD